MVEWWVDGTNKHILLDGEDDTLIMGPNDWMKMGYAW